MFATAYCPLTTMMLIPVPTPRVAFLPGSGASAPALGKMCKPWLFILALLLAAANTTAQSPTVQLRGYGSAIRNWKADSFVGTYLGKLTYNDIAEKKDSINQNDLGLTSTTFNLDAWTGASFP
jgi:hypothetical protein